SDHVAEAMTIARFLAPAARCQQTQPRPATVHPAAPHHGLYRVDARVRRYLWVLELVEVAVAIRVAGDVGVIVRRGLIDHLVVVACCRWRPVARPAYTVRMQRAHDDLAPEVPVFLDVDVPKCDGRVLSAPPDVGQGRPGVDGVALE